MMHNPVAPPVMGGVLGLLLGAIGGLPFAVGGGVAGALFGLAYDHFVLAPAAAAAAASTVTAVAIPAGTAAQTSVISGEDVDFCAGLFDDDTIVAGEIGMPAPRRMMHG